MRCIEPLAQNVYSTNVPATTANATPALLRGTFLAALAGSAVLFAGTPAHAQSKAPPETEHRSTLTRVREGGTPYDPNQRLTPYAVDLTAGGEGGDGPGDVCARSPAVHAITCRESGNPPRGTSSEWYRVAVKGFGRPSKSPCCAWRMGEVLPCRIRCARTTWPPCTAARLW